MYLLNISIKEVAFYVIRAIVCFVTTSNGVWIAASMHDYVSRQNFRNVCFCTKNLYIHFFVAFDVFFQNKQFTERRIWWVRTRKHNRDNKILTIKTNVATISRNRNRVYVVDDMLLLVVVLLLLFFFRFQYFSSDKLAHSLHMPLFGVHKYITGFCWRAIQRTHKRNAITSTWIRAAITYRSRRRENHHWKFVYKRRFHTSLNVGWQSI